MENTKSIQNELLAKIQLLVTTLDEMDEIFDKQSEEMQQADKLESDVDHIIENNSDISNDAKIAIFNKKNEIRGIRRTWKNVHIIREQYYQVNDRLLHKNTRPFFVANMQKTIKQLGQPYKNRVMSEEDVQELLSTKHIDKTPSEKKTKRGKRRKATEKEINQIMEMAHSGIKAKEIATLLAMKENTIYKIIQRYKDVM